MSDRKKSIKFSFKKMNGIPEEIVMIPVVSENISHIGYDEKRRILYVRFLKGSEYKYEGVLKSKFEEFETEIISTGNWFYENIVKKPNLHKCTKL